MSIQGLQWCIKQDCKTPTTKLVLFIMSNYADENGSCYPSEKHLAEIVGISDRQVRRCLSNLVNSGLIRIEERKGTSNRYYLCMDTSVLPVRKQASTNTKPNTKNKSSKVVYDVNFMKFWKLYPRKVGKHAAAIAFAKAEHHAFFDDIMKALRVFVEDNSNTDEKFIPHAATWLNQRRYEDVKEKKRRTLDSLAG